MSDDATNGAGNGWTQSHPAHGKPPDPPPSRLTQRERLLDAMGIPPLQWHRVAQIGDQWRISFGPHGEIIVDLTFHPEPIATSIDLNGGGSFTTLFAKFRERGFRK